MLPILLCYSTHKVFKLHVKSAQDDILYSSVLLKPFACWSATASCYTPAACYLLSHSLPTYEDAARTRLTENMSRDAMHCCVTSQRVRRLHGQKENTASPTVACMYFGRRLAMDLHVTI
jgi:hypothetical protein